MGGAPPPGRGATVRNKMGPVAPVAGLNTLVGELGARVNLPPGARLLGLTMRTMEGAETTPPLVPTGKAWPLLDSNMILLPCGPPVAVVTVAAELGDVTDVDVAAAF